MSVHQVIGFSFLIRLSLTLLNLFAITLYSRLFTPAEIGVHSLAIALCAVANGARMMGAGEILIRSRECDEHRVRQVLTSTLLISWSMGLTVFLASDFAERAVAVSGVADVMRVMSIAFVFAPFIGTSTAVLYRHLRFRMVMTVDLLGIVAALAFTVLFYRQSLSYLSLSLGLIFSTMAQLLAYLVLKPREVSWLPLIPSFKSLTHQLSFGLKVSSANILKTLALAVPEVIIGRIFGAASVAYYSRGFGFMNFIYGFGFSLVRPLISPYFAKLRREGGDGGAQYRRALTAYTGVMIPALAYCGALSEPAIMLMFGSQWGASIPVSEVLTLFFILTVAADLASRYLIVYKLESVNLRRMVLYVMTMALVVVIFADEGIFAVAMSMILVGLIDLAVVTEILARHGHLKRRLYYSTLVSSLIPAIIAVVAGRVTMHVLEPFQFSIVFDLFVYAVVGLVTWLLALIVVRHPLVPEIKQMFGESGIYTFK